MKNYQTPKHWASNECAYITKVSRNTSNTEDVYKFFCTVVSVIATKILSTSFSRDKAAAEERKKMKRRKKEQRGKNLSAERCAKKARI